MSRKQVVYFYEGETEKKLLEFLKKTEQIKSGKLKKFNLWKNRFKSIERTINGVEELFFLIDTDDVQGITNFMDNIQSLKSYNYCLIIQYKNLEDELCYSCNKLNHKKLLQDFYKIKNSDKFKSRFNQDKNLSNTLNKNNFNFSKLWERNKNFAKFLDRNFIKVDINCNYRV